MSSDQFECHDRRPAGSILIFFACGVRTDILCIRGVRTDILRGGVHPEIILENLQALGTPAVEVGSMLTAMLFDMQGYAAMFQRMEQHPEEAPVSASSPSGRIRVRLVDFAAVHSTLQRASIEALARESVRNFCTLWLSGAAYAIALRASASFANAFA